MSGMIVKCDAPKEWIICKRGKHGPTESANILKAPERTCGSLNIRVRSVFCRPIGGGTSGKARQETASKVS